MFNRDLREQIKKLEQQLEHIKKRFEKLEDYCIDSNYYITAIAKQEIQNYFYHNQICPDSKIKSLEHKIDELKEILEELIDKTGFEIRPDILVTKERLEKKSNKKLKGGD